MKENATSVKAVAISALVIPSQLKPTIVDTIVVTTTTNNASHAGKLNPTRHNKRNHQTCPPPPKYTPHHHLLLHPLIPLLGWWIVNLINTNPKETK